MTTSTSTSTTTTTTTTLPPDPNTVASTQLAALQAQDQPVADSLRGSYIAQLSAKYIGLVYNGVTYGPVEVLQDHLDLRNRYGAILIDGGAYGFQNNHQPMDGWFLTIVPTGYATRAGATNWCKAQGLPLSDCFAKLFPPRG